MDGTGFGRWLQTQMDRRDLKQIELARRGGFSTSAVSDWIRGKRLPDPESCDRIADALHIDVETVLRKAGHLPEFGEISDTADALIGLIKRVEWNEEREGTVRDILERYIRNDRERTTRKEM